MMTEKEIIEFEMDGMPVYVEVQQSESGVRRVSRGSEDGIEKAESRFYRCNCSYTPSSRIITQQLLRYSPEVIFVSFISAK